MIKNNKNKRMKTSDEVELIQRLASSAIEVIYSYRIEVF